MIKEIEKLELKNKAMKYYRKGMSCGEIASELKTYTRNIIEIIQEEKEIDKRIQNLNDNRYDKQAIVGMMNVNINRVNEALDNTILNDQRRKRYSFSIER